ncbi:hypothetical protein H9Q72_009730 [Fusarium xylarioides]|uniref:Carboxypeptidase M14B n=1 Tax=Fusarium xylarioides TaxID=221167 RepID=A0A9P7HK81_9HYPO|nr:hypothetical protein H9Q72_009730 [Fusarium xylarioides]
MTLRTAVAGLLCAGLATAVRYNDNQVALTKDGEEAAKNFPEVKSIDLQSPAFLDPKSIPAGFDNGTSGPTSDATLNYFLESLASRNDWLTYNNPSFKSDEGRSIPYVYLSTSSQPEIKANSSSSEKLRVYLQGGVHGNEPGGDQALLALLGKFDANSTWAASILEKMDIMILPRYNPDGVAYFQRFLATGYDPNRDHIRFASQQTREVKALIVDFAPHVMVDAHEYSANRAYGLEDQWAQAVDGQFDPMKNLNIQKDIREYSEEVFVPRIAGAMDKLNLRWSPYITGNAREEPLVFTQLDTQARAGDVSLALTQVMAEEVYKIVEGARQKFIDGVDEVVVTDAFQPTNRTWDFIDLPTGKLVEIPVQFLSSTPVRSNLTRSRPEAYIFPQAWKEAADRLRLNGVTVENIRSEFRGEVEAYNVTSIELASTVYQGTVLNKVTTEIKKKEIMMPAGSFWVPTRQAAAGYVFTVLEPENIDSYATFNILPVNVGDEYPVYRVLG